MATQGYNAYDQEGADIENRRRYAEALQAQGVQALRGGMAGRTYVAPSWTQGLAKVLQSYVGAKGVQDASDERKALTGRMEGDRSREMESVIAALRGTPARPQTMGADDQAMIADQGGEAAPMTAAVPGDPNAAAMAALQSKFGDIRGMAPGMMAMGEARQTREDNQQFRAQEAALAREQRQREIEQRLADARTTAADRATLQRELAQMNIDARKEIAGITAANRPEKMLTVMGPDGEAITMPQSQAAGMTPYNPTTAKAAKEAKTKEGAKTQLNETVNQLKGYYDELYDAGGIVSQDQGSLGNIASRIQSSGVGQAMGGAIGTKNQEQRQKIEQTRPLLLNLIKNATGMSAQQMNSNAEMQLYLRAATDPTLSYESNIEALNNLDKLFGLNIGVKGKEKPVDGAQKNDRRGSPRTPAKRVVVDY